jgi:protein-export membrane protein SecD
MYEMVPSGTPGQRIPQPILVKRASERGLSGKHVEGAGVGHDPATGSPYVSFSLKPDGAQLFGEITQAAIGERLAIILDGEVISAPRINGAIIGGNGQITGSFTDKEAFELATSLENPLAAPLEVKEERGVDPSLGADAIASGKTATLLGVGGVALFMIVYYLTAGLVANVALVLNIVIMLGVMCSLDVTFTLPGIAGIVLTVGMAVDANVLIYERLREELAAGKSVRGAVAAVDMAERRRLYLAAWQRAMERYYTVVVGHAPEPIANRRDVTGYTPGFTWGQHRVDGGLAFAALAARS